MHAGKTPYVLTPPTVLVTAVAASQDTKGTLTFLFILMVAKVSHTLLFRIYDNYVGMRIYIYMYSIDISGKHLEKQH